MLIIKHLQSTVTADHTSATVDTHLSCYPVTEFWNIAFADCITAHEVAWTHLYH